MTPSSPILLFDSGIGGLSVLGALREVMGDVPVIYAADLAGLPYGEKSEAQIAARVAGLLGRMSERYRPRLACIACNTASTIALGMVREVLEIPIVGTVPAIKPAAALTKTGVIGLLGTEATIRQPYVDRLEAEFAHGKVLLRQPAGRLVALAEAKLRGEPIDPSEIKAALEALRAQEHGERMDVLVLACTHFPLLREELDMACKGKAMLVDGSMGIARRIAQLLQGESFSPEAPSRAVFTSEDEDFDALRPAFLRYGISELEKF